MGTEIYLGDALECLREMPDASLDSVVTDPPYGLRFMAKKWDYDVPSVEIWREALRVLKPGAHMLVACGTRTQHRMATNIEDAGFEIRDVITHHYASGFPKSLDVSKAIDKQAGLKGKVTGYKSYSAPDIRANSYSSQNVADRERLKIPITEPASDDAKKFSGFGTGLKPSTEFWTLCRKPLEKGLSIAANVLKFGCGAINIDQSRIGSDTITIDHKTGNSFSQSYKAKGQKPKHSHYTQVQGRWPSNLILQCSCAGPPHEADCPAGMLDRQSGVSKSTKRPPTGKNLYGKADGSGNSVAMLHSETKDTTVRGHTDSGGASRFFLCAKASQAERNAGLEGMPKGEAVRSKRSKPAPGRKSGIGAPRANHHCCVKPIKLMEYLIRLITPPGGTCLDPFLGSGSTGVAAINLNFGFIGIEKQSDYFEIAKKRLAHAETLAKLGQLKFKL